VLGAAAVLSERIRLSSASTVLATADPVRVFQEFAEVDLLSGGRAEIMAGRGAGAFVEPFPLFGHDLHDQAELFAEKLDLLLRVRASSHVTWSGRHRAALVDAGVWPRPVQDPLPVWVAVGGTPQSAIRTGTLGLPMAVAIIGGELARFVPLIELYRKAVAHAGHDHSSARVAINTHTFVADTSQRADAAFAATYMAEMSRIDGEFGRPPMQRREYDALRSPRQAVAVGSPSEVAAKILYCHELFGHQRHIAQLAVALPHADAMRSIELFGTEVAPVVREEVVRRTGTVAE